MGFEQHDALIHTASHQLIKGSAGSGKSYFLSHKILYLLRDLKYSSSQVLVLGSDPQNLNNIKSNIKKISGNDSFIPIVFTFFGACIRLLRLEGHLIGVNPNFTVIDRVEELQFIIDILENLKTSQLWEHPSDILKEIRFLKSQLIEPSFLLDEKNDSYFDPALGSIYASYQAKLKANKYLDRHDIMSSTIKLFRRNPEILVKYVRRFKYIVIDQFEDITSAEFTFCQLLTEFGAKLIVAVDEAQRLTPLPEDRVSQTSIFLRKFHPVRVDYLTDNYRSTGAIINSAIQIMSKSMTPTLYNGINKNDGQSLSYHLALKEDDETTYIAHEINLLVKEENYTLDDIAILYRTRSQALKIKDSLLKKGYVCSIKTDHFAYTRSEIHQLISAIRLVLNIDDDQALMETLVFACASINRDDIKVLENIKKEKQDSIYSLVSMHKLNVSAALLKKIDTFFVEYEDLISWYETQDNPSVYDLVETILDRTEIISRLRKENTLESLEKIENLQYVINVISSQKLSPQKFLDRAMNSLDFIEKKPKNTISLLTFQQSKGKEFKAVVIAGAEEGLLPYYKAGLDYLTLEEERRLLYIGITRAKERVYFTSAYQRTIGGDTWYDGPARFLKSILYKYIAYTVSDRVILIADDFVSRLKIEGFNFEVLETPKVKRKKKKTVVFNVGDVVNHTKYGEGIIRNMTGSDENTVLDIDFKDQVRKMMMRYIQEKSKT